jgi:hypothetical protein
MAWNDTGAATNLIPHEKEGSRMQQGEQNRAQPGALDLAGFAQEFLRRNADYRSHYRELTRHPAESPSTMAPEVMARRWGLSFPVRPRHLRR